MNIQKKRYNNVLGIENRRFSVKSAAVFPLRNKLAFKRSASHLLDNKTSIQRHRRGSESNINILMQEFPVIYTELKSLLRRVNYFFR